MPNLPSPVFSRHYDQQLPLPGPIGTVPIALPYVEAAETSRPRPPEEAPTTSGEWIWTGEEWRWFPLADPSQLRLPLTPGVLPGARARVHSAGPHAVPWHVLDARLGGVERRRGRKGVWDPELAAAKTMADVRAQTLDMGGAGRMGDVRIPEWLRDPGWQLSRSELALVVLLLAAYERGWGGVYDCQTTVASELGLSERTLRRLLHGQSWTRSDGTMVTRPGLVERGIVTVRKTWGPSSAANGRPSDLSWLLLRLGPGLEPAARWHAFSKSWTGSAPRGSGWSRSAALAAVACMRAAARVARYQAAGEAWAVRHRGDAVSEEASPEEASVPIEERAEPGEAVEAGGVSGSPPPEIERAERAPEIEPDGGEIEGGSVASADRLAAEPDPPPSGEGLGRRGPSPLEPPKKNEPRYRGVALSISGGGEPDTPPASTASPGSGERPRGEARSGPGRDCVHRRHREGRCLDCGQQFADLGELAAVLGRELRATDDPEMLAAMGALLGRARGHT